MKEIADKVSEKNKNNEFSEPFTNSAEQGIISQKDYFDREIVNNENLDGYYIVRNDDFIYNPRISATAPVGPINRNRLGRNGVMSPLYTVFRTHDIDNLYLEFYFKTTKWHRFMKLNGDSGARFDRFTISSTQFMEMPIPYPTLEEQQKIGKYFDSIDHLITLQQRKCDEVKSLKKYMLQKMFPQNEQKVPEIRFEGFTEAWEQRKFSDIAARESFVSTSASDIPSVEYEDVVAEEGRLNKDIRLKEAVKSGITFDGSQVLYGKLRPYLHNWLNPDFKGIAVGDWWVLKPINMDKNFLYRLIQTQQFDNIANQSSGSKMPRADWNLISNSEFMVPFSKEEQSKIGRYFDSLDNLITLHQRKPISHLNHPTIHTKHKGEEKYVRIRVNDREKTNRTANLRRFPVDIPRRFKDGGGSVGEFQIYSGAE